MANYESKCADSEFRCRSKIDQFYSKKMDKLEQYYDRIIFADVFLKVQNTKGKENKIVEILLSVPGDEIIVKKLAKSFEEGTDNCAQSLERWLLKRKHKIKAMA